MAMNDPPETGGGREIALRDEVLELLYWFEGEGFAREATVRGMTRFLAFAEEEVAGAVSQLLARGDLVASDDGTFRLSADGRREAARRFADDFGPLLHQGHGECNDPACDCHADPSGSVGECRGGGAHGPRPW
jgi:hypothetical protein